MSRREFSSSAGFNLHGISEICTGRNRTVVQQMILTTLNEESGFGDRVKWR